MPSVRLARPGDGQDLVIAEGLVKFGSWWEPVPATLPQFLGWAFTGGIVPHKLRVSLDGPALVWTAPHYIRAEGEYLAGGGLEADIDRNLRRIEAQLAAGRRSQERHEEVRRKNAVSRATARSDAAAAEQALRAAGDRRAKLTAKLTAQRSDVARAIDLLAGKYGITATVGWSRPIRNHRWMS